MVYNIAISKVSLFEKSARNAARLYTSNILKFS